MAEKKAVIVSYSDPAEGRLRVALGCVWGPEQALGAGVPIFRGVPLCGCWGHGSAGTGSQRSCELGQAISEKGTSASTILLPPF